MVQKAVVKRLLSDDKAEIEVQRQSACSGDCHKCSGCGAPTSFVQATANNLVGARVGDIVTVEGSSQVIIRYAAIVYTLPLVLFFAFYAVCSVLALSTWICAFAGIAGFVGGVAHAIWRNQKVNQQSEFVFSIIKIG